MLGSPLTVDTVCDKDGSTFSKDSTRLQYSFREGPISCFFTERDSVRAIVVCVRACVRVCVLCV